MMGEKITIIFDIFDSGCLAGVLERQLYEVERHQRIAGHTYTPEGQQDVEALKQQLRGCISAVEAARARPQR
jgi:hypothetical protein